MMKFLSLFAILLCSLSAISQNQFFTAGTLPRKPDGEVDFSQVESLRESMAQSDIILLGEPAHEGKYYDIKIQLVKYLHESLGFDVIAFESGLYSMERVNGDIQLGNDIGKAFEGGLFPVWTASEEFRRLYGYLQTLRTKGDTLTITGFDNQVSATNASKRFLAELALSAHAVNANPETLKILQAQLESLESGNAGLTPDFNSTSLKKLEALARSIESVPSLVLYHQSLITWIGHFRDLYEHHVFEKSLSGEFQGSDSNVRDSLMAANMLFIYRTLHKGKKIIGWGATTHFGKHFEKMKTGSNDSKYFRSMGYHLKKELGPKVFVLAVSDDDHYPNTLEKNLAQKGAVLAWLPATQLAAADLTSCALGSPATGAWNEVVDGILFFSDHEEKLDVSKARYFVKGRVMSTNTREPVSFASLTVEGTSLGTASSIEGNYFLAIDSNLLNTSARISCIGYKTKRVAIKTLLREGEILLTPEAEILDEVLISAKAPDASEILRLAITHIPDNYTQTPFNMEFYSSYNMEDTTGQKSYLVESVFSSYYEGYYPSAKKNYKVIEKREGGDYFMKEKTYGLSQWPMWDLAFNDIFSTNAKYQIVTEKGLGSIAPKLVGIELFDGDTVFAIKYQHQFDGVIYIHSKDFAILRHATVVQGKGFTTRSEILYKKQNGKYFPYAANGDYRHPYNVDGIKKTLKITNRVVLKRIVTSGVVPFEHAPNLWTPKEVPFRKDYWEKNYPKL